MLDKLMKQTIAVEHPIGQEIIEMMREYSERQSLNNNINSDVIKGFQIMIQHVKTVRLRYDNKKEDRE